MLINEIISKLGLSNLKLVGPFVEAEFDAKQANRDAAWELYVELITRSAVQELPDDKGDNKEVLDSLYTLFPITREILKKYKSDCMDFSKLAIAVLNQILRPFLSKWHKKYLQMQKNNMEDWGNFRDELADLQNQLKEYTTLLSELAGGEEYSTIQ